MLKYQIKNWLEQQDWYYQLRYSERYFYWQQKLRPRLARALADEKHLYQEALGLARPSLIFDIGASEGYTAKGLLQLTQQLVCVEPASKNVKALKARFNGQDRVLILHQAIGAVPGKAKLHLANRGTTLHTLSETWKKTLEAGNALSNSVPTQFSQTEEVEVTTLDLLIQQYGRPDFIKIDVEGFELAVLKGLSQKVPLLSFEANLPIFQKASLQCIDLLLALDPKASFNYAYQERLEWPTFSSADQLKALLQQGQINYLEIFCRMTT
ncbi:MAG: FkbM family methyltransferase [Bacteroidota bacterium]